MCGVDNWFCTLYDYWAEPFNDVLVRAQFYIMASVNCMLQNLANSTSIIRFMVIILVNEFCVSIIDGSCYLIWKFKVVSKI